MKEKYRTKISKFPDYGSDSDMFTQILPLGEERDLEEDTRLPPYSVAAFEDLVQKGHMKLHSVKAHYVDGSMEVCVPEVKLPPDYPIMGRADFLIAKYGRRGGLSQIKKNWSGFTVPLVDRLEKDGLLPKRIMCDLKVTLSAWGLLSGSCFSLHMDTFSFGPARFATVVDYGLDPMAVVTLTALGFFYL